MDTDVKAKQRPRTKPPEERRDELMNAAEKLFLEKGLGPTTIEEITSIAGVAKGTFYLHFSSKEEIQSALCERFYKKHVEKLEAVIARRPKNDWRGKLAAWAKAAVTGFLDDGPLVNMLFHSHPRPPDGRPSIIIDHLKGLLEAGAAEGAWSLDDPSFTALFLFGGLHGIVDDALLNDRRISRTQFLQRMQRLCLRTVGLAED